MTVRHAAVIDYGDSRFTSEGSCGVGSRVLQTAVAVNEDATLLHNDIYEFAELF
jgi:hypothetical protein